MKPFNLNEYLADTSRKVVTREGKPVRIICTDAKREYPIIGLIKDKGKEYVGNYLPDGKLCSDATYIGDLFFDSEKKDGWVNLYRIADTDELEASCIFSTKEEAEFYRGDEPKPNYVATTRIEWEE